MNPSVVSATPAPHHHPATPAPHHHPAAMGPAMESGMELMETAMVKFAVIEVVKTLVMKAVRMTELVDHEN